MAEYSDIDLDRIVGAAIGGRIARIEERFNAHSIAEEHTGKATKDAITETRDAIARLHERIDERADSLAVCKDMLKREISETYVTRSELTIALNKTAGEINEKLGGKIDLLREQYSADRAEISKYKTTISAVIITLTMLGGLVSWSLSNYNTAQQIAETNNGRDAIMQQILSEIKARRQ